MPGRRSTRTSEASYRCLRGFSYPASRGVRDRIRAGDHIPREEGGDWKRYAEGTRLTNPPGDLIADWLKRGLVEPIGAKGKDVSEEVPADDA